MLGYHMTVTIPSDPHRNGRVSTLAGKSLAPTPLPAAANDASKVTTWAALRANRDSEEPAFSHNTLLAIPELESFDQEELNVNPVLNQRQSVPLVGALLMAEGLITQEQLNACLLLQLQDHPDQPIGQILVRCGYISQQALDLALGIQVELKSSLVNSIEAQGLPQADLTALVLHARGGELAYAALSQLGVFATPARDWAEFARALKDTRFDMAIIGGDLLDETAALPDQSTPIMILPPIVSRSSGGFYLPQWVRAIIERFVIQARVQRRQRDALERLHQRDFELSAVAALSRSICAAHSPHDAVMQLMLTIRDLFGVEAGTLYRFDRPASQLVFEVVIGPHQETLYQQRLPIDRGLAGWVVRNGEPLLIPDVRRDTRFEGMFDHQSGFQTRSVLCVPLLARGQVCGVIQLINKLNGDFNERDLLLLRILAAMGALAAAPDANLFEHGLGAEGC
jgi:putative methionine-R-sulfoxide reductase with GAF domain